MRESIAEDRESDKQQETAMVWEHSASCTKEHQVSKRTAKYTLILQPFMFHFANEDARMPPQFVISVKYVHVHKGVQLGEQVRNEARMRLCPTASGQMAQNAGVMFRPCKTRVVAAN